MKSFKFLFLGLILSFALIGNVSAQSLLQETHDVELVGILNATPIYQSQMNENVLITDVYVVVKNTNLDGANGAWGWFAVSLDDHNGFISNPWAYAYQLTGLLKPNKYMKVDTDGVHRIVGNGERLWMNTVGMPFVDGVFNPTFKVDVYVFGHIL